MKSQTIICILFLVAATSFAAHLHRNREKPDLSKIVIRHEESEIKEEEKVYVVILDAGSSSTKLNILYWKNRLLKDPAQYEKVYMKGKEWRKGPGIQKIKTNEELTTYLKEFLDKAKASIP
jgi:activator of 2-hydroxyglutaryl-CoA dehydratase